MPDCRRTAATKLAETGPTATTSPPDDAAAEAADSRAADAAAASAAKRRRSSAADCASPSQCPCLAATDPVWLAAP